MVPYVLEGVPKLHRKPAMLAEGMADQAIPPDRPSLIFKTLFPAGPVVRLDEVEHFCQEDASETLVALIQLFIQVT
jgi:cis-3-alkyl-4-acyloxetan-2-one decarboxylase